MFWQNRNTENMLYGGRSGSPSPIRRASIERVQKASRVKNSNILALEQKQEYDPTRLPQIERPLSKVQGGSFRASVSSGLRSDDSADNTITSIDRNSMISPKPTMPSADDFNATRTPSKDQASPTKSSMSPSKFKSSFDHETGNWTFDSSMDDHDLPSGRSLHRHAKSVTFDAAPPQINEYEMATPDLSSVGTNSREGSYESFGDEYEDGGALYDPANIDHHEDSFDASLEDTDKTPVVGPDDWRGDSPMINGRQPQQWEGSPMPEASPSMPDLGRSPSKRTDSGNSESRPLPPLPGAGHARSQSNGSAPGSPAMSATAERMLGSHRSLPSPPAALASKSDIHNIGNGKMTLEERLKLMMLSDDNGAKTAAEQQRERRLRRANGRERFGSPISEPESTTDVLEEQEADDTIGDISLLGDYEMPSRISRESIMRRVNGNKAFERESDYNFSSPAPSSSPQRSPTRSPERQLPIDPDVPIPSTEDSMLDGINEDDEGSVIITRNPEDEYDDDSVFDLYQDSEAEPRDAEVPGDDDSESHYSQPEEFKAQMVAAQEAESKQAETKTTATEEVTTPRATTPVAPTQPLSLGNSIPDLGPSTRHSAFSQDFESYMVPEPEPEPEKVEEPAPQPKRPHTPERRMSKPEYDGSGWGEPEDEYDDEPGTPDSVIHHPVADDEGEDEEVFEEEPVKEAPVVPERTATVKASGSKLKTRVSNTPSDLQAMREARRQVSHEVPNVPPIPAKHRNRLSRDVAPEQIENGEDSEYLERHPSFKNRSLTLDLDMGLSLDQDFERVIEAQKVAFNLPLHNNTPTPSNTMFRQASGKQPHSPTRSIHANASSRPQRGYLMRQNTKVVTASDKDGADARLARSVGNSPVKQQHDRPQSCIVEPWNGKRKSSVRKGSNTNGAATRGPVPPMPGQHSNAVALNQVAEEEDHAEPAAPETGERGRLFVKVMGVKDLDLPLPKSESISIPNRDMQANINR